MTDGSNTSDRAFHLVEQSDRVIRTARMLDEKTTLNDNQRRDIRDRFYKFLEQNDLTQAQAAREIGVSSQTLSETLRGQKKLGTTNKHFVNINNWMELTAKRIAIIKSRGFVTTCVAREILTVAQNVAETCKMGVVFGPAQIGKTFTLKALEGQQIYGDPALIRINESILRPLPLCRALSSKFELAISGTFDTLFRRLVKRLEGTKRMLMFDEAERLHYKSLECLRDLHDQTGCPVLFAGKPKIYERLGIRDMGDFSEVTDQLASRIVMVRDLTERTRDARNPEPLFSKEDILNIIKQSGLDLRVSKDGADWLQAQACTLGRGGIGKAITALYLAFKIAYSSGEETITAEHLEAAQCLTMGHEDAQRLAENVVKASGIRRVV